MFKSLFAFGLYMVVLILGVSALLKNDRLTRLLDASTPEPIAAAVENAVGEVYYACRSYNRAQGYFRHVYDRHPNSSQADNASYMAIQSARFDRTFSSASMMRVCRQYLSRFPNGQHATSVKRLTTEYRKLTELGLEWKKLTLAEGLEGMNEI